MSAPASPWTSPGPTICVIATPELAARLGLPIKNDLRGKFKDDADALRYARTALLPRLNPYLCLVPRPAPAGQPGGRRHRRARGMAFWITGPKAQDRPGADEDGGAGRDRGDVRPDAAGRRRARLLVARRRRGVDETPGVSLGSRFGKITTVSDYVANYSVLSGVPVPALKQKPQPPAPAFDPTKVYLALTMSDGDNLCTWRGYFRQYFTDPLHGTFPVGWGMAPSLIDVAPTLARWYYDHAAPTDEFLCDVSGVGYMYPPDWATALKDRPAATASFYGLTQTYMDRMDMKTVRLMNVRTEDIAGVGADLPGVAFLMPDYGTQGGDSYSPLHLHPADRPARLPRRLLRAGRAEAGRPGARQRRRDPPRLRQRLRLELGFQAVRHQGHAGRTWARTTSPSRPLSSTPCTARRTP